MLQLIWDQARQYNHEGLMKIKYRVMFRLKATNPREKMKFLLIKPYQVKTQRIFLKLQSIKLFMLKSKLPFYKVSSCKQIQF